MSYGIQPFKDEVLCDVAPLDVCDVLLGQPYMWKRHVVYESQPRSVIVSLGGHLYRITEVVSTTDPPKNVSQGSISYYKIHLLHNLFKRGTEGHCNHYSFTPSTFYLTEAGRQGCSKRKKIHSAHRPLM